MVKVTVKKHTKACKYQPFIGVYNIRIHYLSSHCDRAWHP